MWLGLYGAFKITTIAIGHFSIFLNLVALPPGLIIGHEVGTSGRLINNNNKCIAGIIALVVHV